jgi:hypothetical protein
MLVHIGALLCYGPVLGMVKLSSSLCLSVGILRCAGRRCSVLICFGGLKFYLPFVLFCVPGRLCSEYGSWVFLGFKLRDEI